MTITGPWSTADFDSLSWHDVHVHGFTLGAYSATRGTADLSFHIDFILEWSKDDSGFSFLVAPAELVFHDVFGLQMALDYRSASAGMVPFSLDRIERSALPHGGCAWQLVLNWPHGTVSFEASGFTQRLTGTPVRAAQQWLAR